MEGQTITLTKAELSNIVLEATTKVIIHFQGVLSPKEEPIKTTKAYSATEVAKIFSIDRTTVYKWYDKKECLLKRNKCGKFLGSSVKAEYERLNGK